MKLTIRSAIRPCATHSRRLAVEPLEDRRLLDAAAPWHNAALPLDVNMSDSVSAVDALGVIGQLLERGVGPLPAPPEPPLLLIDVNADNALSARDAAMVISRLLSPTTVTVSTLVPFSIDTTPEVTVKAFSPAGLADGTQVKLDIDLNSDGDYSDEGELHRSSGTLIAGEAHFTLDPALPPSPESGPYIVRIRARVKDIEGVEGLSLATELEIDTEMSNALENYVHAFDPSYGYSLANTVPGAGFTFYALDMTSQTWRSSADVNKPAWRHWVEVIVPTGTITSSALMLINGGNNNFGSPPSNPNSDLALLATMTGSVVVNLRTVPSEPLVFSDETYRNRTEDEIIAYSFDKYMTYLGDEGNETWPVLVAMAKSAVRAMDTIQDFVPQVTGNQSINDFIVTGYSKRGWTTWLTAASDDRVKAIIPGVFDNLNQGPQMVHHYSVLGKFSEEVVDYSDKQIFERIMTPEGQQLSKIVDPYRYLRNGRFDDMPKLILNGAGDEFFVSDSAQFYIHDLPGDKNYLRYFPNAGHGLDASAVTSSLTFLNAVLNNLPMPRYAWTVEPNGDIRLTTVDAPLTVKLWQATNPTERDFRHGYHPEIVWTSSVVTGSGGVYADAADMPAQGATAYFLEMTYPSGVPNMPYIFTTEIRVKSTLPLHAWPYPSGFSNSPASLAAFVEQAPVDSGAPVVESLDDVALGVALAASARPTSEERIAVAVPPPPATAIAAESDAPSAECLAALYADDWNVASDESDEGLGELLLVE
jgi:PhoPQ-activated pathogenicity-related protein